MTGIMWGILAGVSFGCFQLANRRANQLVDAFRVTFGVVVVGATALGVIVVTSQDLTAARSGPARAYLLFAAAGVVHFIGGWTCLALSQQRIGAATTGAVVAATPLVASLLASLVLDERLTVVTWLGVVLVTAGVAMLSLRGDHVSARRVTVPWFALGAAASWGTSPLFIRWGLELLPMPLVGVFVGLSAAALVYLGAFLVSGRLRAGPPTGAALGWIVTAGSIVAFAIAAQWLAVALAPIAVAYALMQLSSPVVVVAAPIVIGGVFERLTVRLVLAVAAIGAGSVMVVLTGS